MVARASHLPSESVRQVFHPHDCRRRPLSSRTRQPHNANPKSVPRRTPGTEKPVGEWNAYDIVCRSNTVTIHVNGILQNEITGSSVDAGAIGLQAEGKPVEFRNLVLEPLAETAKP
jgi:hypothetical protein